MSGSEIDIELLADKVDDLQLELHAATIAITVLSSCIAGLSGDRQVMRDSFASSWVEMAKDNLELQADSGYAEKLKERILQLL